MTLNEILFHRLPTMTFQEKERFAIISLAHASEHIAESDWDLAHKIHCKIIMMRFMLAIANDQMAVVDKDSKQYQLLSGIGKVVTNVSETIQKLPE